MGAEAPQPSSSYLPNQALINEYAGGLSGRLLDMLPLGVCICDHAGAIVRYNRRATELWGRTPRLGELADVFWATLGLAAEAPDATQATERFVSGVLANGVSVRERDMLIVRDDSSRINVRVNVDALRDDAGTLIGAVTCWQDITERKYSEESVQHLGAIIDSSNDAIISKNLNGLITSWNHGAARLFGYTANEAIGRPITMLIPADRQNEEVQILQRIRRGEPVEHYDTIRRRKDGSLVEVSLAVSPVKNAAGVVVGASKIARDITERKRAAEKQILLLREMNHRVKNLFTLAGSVVTLSARFARTPKELSDAVRARLAALSQAHDLTMPNLADVAQRTARQTTLRALIQTIVSSHNDASPQGANRVTIDGSDVVIGDSAMTSVALLLHEFMTNAAKYGALSVPTGHVDATWTVSDGEVHLIWRERGGPPIGDQINAEGFGSFLAHATVKGQLGGSITRDWDTAGLTVHLTVPLERLAV